tara:strand:+ start:608 stop:751 length:144 start_codon:yes stop_codon:yes gene_type:complete
MKWQVELYVGGKLFKEDVIASNRSEAEATAKARNPFARVISINWLSS